MKTEKEDKAEENDKYINKLYSAKKLFDENR